tara:strand:- start:283 stop:495 length:213 start_codon:yes stop_codon:yes gene_type:complete
MSEIISITLDEATRVNNRIKTLEDAIKQLPIYTHNGKDHIISTESPDLTLALENLMNLATESFSVVQRSM